MNLAEIIRIVKKFAPIFYQEIGWRVQKSNPNKNSPPETDSIVDHDFDGNTEGWLPESKLDSINLLLNQDKLREEGRILYFDWGCEIIKEDSKRVRLDLRPVVYYAVMASQTQYFIWYLVYHPKDTGSTHSNDLEGSMVIVDRDSEIVIALQPFGHNQTMQFPSWDFWNETLKRPNEFIDKHGKRRIEDYLACGENTKGKPVNRPAVWIEMWGHGHRGKKIIRGHWDKPIGYVTYYPASFNHLPFTAPPFNNVEDLKAIYDYDDPYRIARRYKLVPFGDSLDDDSHFARAGLNARPLTWRDENGGSGLDLFAHPIKTLLVNFGVERWLKRYEVSREYTFNPYRQ